MPTPVLRESTDALVRMIKTNICGKDLHISKMTAKVGFHPISQPFLMA